MAFRNKGHDAFSCDTLPCEGGHPEWHFQEDVLEVLKREKFDMGIFHPPCTYLSYAANAVWDEPGRIIKRLEALEFFRKLWEASIEKICMENPRGCASPVIAKFSQQIEPYYFGDSYQKLTWLWLKNLPLLVWKKEDDFFGQKTAVNKPEPMYICQGEKCKGKKINWCEGYRGGNRKHNRARFWPGIAEAMSSQWGCL